MPKTMRGVMEEFKAGILHSGSKSGPVVRNRKQAIAIGLSENGLSKPKYKHLRGSGKFTSKDIKKGYRRTY